MKHNAILDFEFEILDSCDIHLIGEDLALEVRGAGTQRGSRLSFARQSPAPPEVQFKVQSPKSKMHRGVSSVLAMIFLVIFSSLVAAMAVVAQSNLRTADSGLKMSRAMSAAETGMTFATRRLATEAARFVVNKGVIDGGFGQRIWMGTYSGADGAVTIVQPTGYNTGPGIIHALKDATDRDGHNIAAPTGTSAPSQATIDQAIGRLRAPAVKLSDEANSPSFILTYELLSNTPAIRVTSMGVDGDVTRTLEMDYKINKKIEFAILSPNRVMIGKNVLIEGPLGTRFGIQSGELNGGNGDPLVMRSDFYYLNAALDAKLDTLYAKIKAFDVDGDNRLRPAHPQESLGLNDVNLIDYDGDQYVDDFDLFLKHFDTDADHRIVYDAALAQSAGLGTLTVEYGGSGADDKQLLRLIDETTPDRDGDGVPGTASDRMLGYKDGVINGLDQYAKVNGRLAFAVDRATWEAAKSAGFSYQQVVKGAIRTAIDVPAAKFAVTQEEMREITTDMFAASAAWFSTAATGSFSGQAGTPTQAWEEVPFGAVQVSNFGTRGAYDYYNRPIYQNKTFTNVRIPKGTNALFKNCTFVGVTYIETNTNCGDVNWNQAGALKKVETSPGVFAYQPHYPGLTADVGGVPSDNTRTESNNIRFDNCTFLGSLSGDRPIEYTHYRNKIQMTGNTRFYIDPADPDLATQADVSTLTTLLNSIPASDRAEMEKSSILAPGWSIDVGSFNNEVNMNPLLTPKVKLKGTIIAGILDVRGTVDLLGTLLMTYRPVAGQGPLHYGGLTDAFNTTIGYFHSTDGDAEGGDPTDTSFQGFGEIRLRYDPNTKLPDGIPWPLRIDPDPTTYVE